MNKYYLALKKKYPHGFPLGNVQISLTLTWHRYVGELVGQHHLTWKGFTLDNNTLYTPDSYTNDHVILNVAGIDAKIPYEFIQTMLIK